MDQDDVIKNLRSCLISCKFGIKLDSLRADYRMITGETLPYKQFGYPSVEAFVRNIPEVAVTKKGGELYVEAVPSKTTAHLTKLISRQKTRRKIRPKKWTPPRSTSRSFSGGYKSNSFNGFPRNNHVNSSNSFARSTPGKSNLYTDLSRPIPLMETIVSCPFNNMSHNNERFPASTPVVPPTKRLMDKMTKPNVTSNQSVVNCKIIENLSKITLVNDNTASSVINVKPKTAEAARPTKLNERLKVSFSNISASRAVSLSTIDNRNNGRASLPVLDISQIAPRSNNLDPREELQLHTNTLNLSPPIYKMHRSKKDKHSNKITIYASVKVGAHTFNTYPEDAASEEEAEKIAARLALVNFAKGSSSPGVTTVDVKLVKERIVDIVTLHHSGVFMHLLPDYYCEQYGEALPHNWQRIIDECADINQEKGVGDSTILCRSSSTSQRTECNSEQFINMSESSFGEKILLKPIGPATPDKLTVPDMSIWQVYTTCVMSTVEVWVRLGDDNDNFVEMTSYMTKHYNQIKEFALAPAGCVVDDYYAVFEDDYWHRVQCTDIDLETGTVTVFFIDEGYDEQYKSNVLHPLDKKFCVLPAQAMRVALQGLEDFSDYAQTVAEIENHLLVDRMFFVKVHSMDVDEYGSYATVTFYDTSKDDVDVNMNEILFDKILDNFIPKVHLGELIELYITHIDECGKVYSRINNTFIRTLLSNEAMSQMLANNTMVLPVKKINFTKIYLVKWNSQWYRAKLVDIPNEDEITVFLVDFGRTVTAPRNDFFHLDGVSKALQCIPQQAMQIFLQNISQSMYNRGLVARFRELVSTTDLLLAKVVKIGASGIPTVEIFKRIGPNNMLASINTSLIYNGELSKTNEDDNNNKLKKRLERKNSRVPESVSKLNPPKISDVGQYFDVHVTLAAHPGHFIVQPLDDMKNLRTMMTDLQTSCNNYDGPPLESIGEGKIYAGKLINDWYRVYVTDFVSDNEVSVYFCDFGDVMIVSRSSLQPLKSEFSKLPYQAIKAKLVGIKPLNIDWSVADCLRFKDLVLNKNFVSVVVESEFDKLSPANATVLGLRLIDVSTEQDVYIDRLLVDEGRAKYIDGFESLPSS